MKSKFFITIALLGIGLLLSAAAFTRQNPQEVFLEKRAALIVRNIGHKLLLQVGDSSSRVLPVKKMENGIFQLEFQSEFYFLPDTLVEIVRRELGSSELSPGYIVNVFNCKSNEVVYDFEIRADRTEIIPCMGRAQPRGCYLIQISFIDFQSSQNLSNHYPLYIFTLIGLSLVAFVGRSYLKREKKAASISVVAGISIGKYSFSIDDQSLRYNSELIELSDKEAKLLSIFAVQQNELISREELHKKVWEDDGVFTGRSLDVFISKLRKKLINDPSVQIINVHGKGYKLESKNADSM